MMVITDAHHHHVDASKQMAIHPTHPTPTTHQILVQEEEEEEAEEEVEGEEMEMEDVEEMKTVFANKKIHSFHDA